MRQAAGAGERLHDESTPTEDGQHCALHISATTIPDATM